jgi:hypothetical protein
MYKNNMSLARVLVAGDGLIVPNNRNTLPWDHLKPYKRESNPIYIVIVYM